MNDFSARINLFAVPDAGQQSVVHGCLSTPIAVGSLHSTPSHSTQTFFRRLTVGLDPFCPQNSKLEFQVSHSKFILNLPIYQLKQLQIVFCIHFILNVYSLFLRRLNEKNLRKVLKRNIIEANEYAFTFTLKINRQE